MKTDTAAYASELPAEKPSRHLFGTLRLLWDFLCEGLYNLDFAIQVRLALWATERRRRRCERPAIH